MVSGNKKSKSKPTATPTKTPAQTTAHRQPLPSDENLEITEPAISLELRQTNLEEQVKKQNELIETSINEINTLEKHIIFLEGKLAVTETVSKLLGKKAHDLDTYSRRPCLIVPGVKKEKNENMENLTETIIDKLEQTGIPKEELKTNIGKLHGTGPYQPSTNTQPVIVRFKSHSFQEKIYNKRKNVNKDIKLVSSLTRRRLELLNKLQIALNDSKENGILDVVKFIFADVHGSMKLVLQNPYKDRSVFSFNSELEFYQFVD